MPNINCKQSAVKLSQLNNCRGDLKPGCRLSGINLVGTKHHFVEMDRLLKKYVTSLITNINNRFQASMPVLITFSIFDVMAILSIRSQEFKEYGDDHIKSLAEHFFTESEMEEANVNIGKLKAEWGKFKFDLIDWKADLPKDIKEGKGVTNSTTWILHRMLC